MDVYLDRAVSFSQLHKAQTAGEKGNQEEKPRIKRVVCHRGDSNDRSAAVTVVSDGWRNGRRVRFQSIAAQEVTLENENGEVNAAGPGEMRLFELGERALPDAADDKRDAGAPAEQVYRLTRVAFDSRLRGNQRAQSVAFFGPNRVAHAPTDDPDLRINPDRLPPGAFTLTCQMLEIGSQEQNGRRYATMLAEGKADIYANSFSGRADVIKYDELKKEQIIFDSKDGGNPAVLYHFRAKGELPRELMGKTIFYFRQTNDFRVIKAFQATSSQ